ncbi:MAG: hypothetical protein ACI8XO_002885 [Verrucomicrobiales bacterium]|jgi:hypothetical protein
MRVDRTGNLGLLTLSAGLFLTLQEDVSAGMTVYGLNDFYRMRLEELSFFLVLMLICTIAFRYLWNTVAKDLAWLPQLGWKQATSLSVLLGVLMLLILTMISGIREVLTPEAWRKQGTAYRLDSAEQEPVRKRSVEQLRAGLFAFAEANGGHFPKHDFSEEIADKLWDAPDRDHSRYIYFPGKQRTPADGVGSSLLAIEPTPFGSVRFGILTSGELRRFTATEIRKLISYTQEEGSNYGG